MKSISRQTWRNIFLYSSAVLFFALIRVCFIHNTPMGIISAAGYIVMILIWGYSVIQRIPSKEMRRWLLLADFFMVLWIFLRVLKYYFFYKDLYSRYFWYAYYIPQILIPLFVLFSAICAGRKQRRFAKKWYYLFIPAAVLIIGTLTNDVHQLAFRFNPGFQNWNFDYGYGLLYFADMLWLFGLFIISICVLYQRSRVAQTRKYVWMPFMWLLPAVLYGIYYSKGSFFFEKKLFEMPEAVCFLMISLLECCIQTGLIPSNIGYNHIFMASSISAQIADMDGHTIFFSHNARQISVEQRRMAETEDIFIDEDTILHSEKIHGGRLFWTDDIRIINQLNHRLADTGDELAGENALLKAESQLKKQRIKIAEQTQLYDSITILVSTQIQKINSLLLGLTEDSPEFEKNMKLACVLNAYVKRRSNLALLCKKEEYLKMDELALCIRESVDYLMQYGVVCSFWQIGAGEIFHLLAEKFYEGFEMIVESVLPSLSVLLITLGAEHGKPFLKLSMEGITGLPMRELEGIEIRSEEQDGTIFLIITEKGDMDHDDVW